MFLQLWTELMWLKLHKRTDHHKNKNNNLFCT